MLKAAGVLAGGAVLGGLGMCLYLYLTLGVDVGGPLVGDDAETPIAGIEALQAGLDAGPGLDDAVVAERYRELAAADIDAALRALAAIEPAASRRAASLGLLDVLGDDAAAAERIAQALAPSERPAFLAARLGRRAESDAPGAFRELLALSNGTLKRMAAERVAAAWASQDPPAALAEASLLPDDIAMEFRRNVMTEWARLDAGAVLAYLETAGPDPLDIAGAISFLAADPEGLLAVADRRGDMLGTTLEVTALGVLAESDPETALARVEAMPAGVERDQAVMMVAIFYALEDPDAATSWVERMVPASPNARLLIAAGLAEQDPARALDMLSRGPPTQETQMMLGLVVQTAAQQTSTAKPLAEELAARSDTQGRNLLANLMAGWVTQDPDGALSWLTERESELDPALLGNAAAALAGRDAATAAAWVERIPARYRDVWITRMAGPYGQNNLDGAAAWLAQFRGEPVYDAAFVQLVTQGAQSNPSAAGQLLITAGAEQQRAAGRAVATSWARRDTQAAAQWALSLSDSAAREQALAAVVQAMAQRSPDEAQALLDRRISDDESRQRIAALAGLDAAP